MINKKRISQEDGALILKELCNRVGEDSETFDFKQDEWYLTKTWTEEEQEDFRVWLGKFLEDKRYCKGKYRGQNHGYYEAGKLIMNYGWKIKNLSE